MVGGQWMAAAIVLTAGCVGGCANAGNEPVSRLAPQPTLVDEAIAGRDWSVTTSHFANGGVWTTDTGFAYTSDSQTDPALAAAFQPVLFAAQSIAWPVVWIARSGWETRLSSGVRVPSSYTGITE